MSGPVQPPQENKMGVMPIRRLLLTMSGPMMVSMLIQALYNVVDSMFVSYISEGALTAVSLAYPMQNLMIAVATGTGVGVNALLSRNLGEKNFEMANRAAGNAIFLGVVSFAVFALVGRFGRELVEIFFPREKLEKLKFLQSSPKRDALFWLIFTVPGTPKDLLCYFAGLTDLSWGKWLLLCTVGRLPSVLTSTIGGSALGVKDYQFAILVFAVTLAVSGVGLLIYRAVCRRHERKQQEHE